MALKALSTLNVRRAEKFPRFTNSVTYLRIFFLEKKNIIQTTITETEAHSYSSNDCCRLEQNSFLNVQLTVAMSATMKLLYF